MATPSAQFSLTLRVELEKSPGTLGRLSSAIGGAGASIGAVDILEADEQVTLRELTVDCGNSEHWQQVVAAVEATEGVRLIETTDRTFELHRGGKISTGLKSALATRDDLSMAYTPGVARATPGV